MGGNILIVDNAEIFRRELLKYHKQAEAFANFADAHNRIQSGDISLVVTELLDVTGSLPFSELVAAVRGLDGYIPIIAQSNKKYEDRINIGEEYSLDVTIPKSRHPKEFLLSEIDTLLAKPEEYKGNTQHRCYRREETVDLSFNIPGRNGAKRPSYCIIQKKG